jgi:exopolyphosphatase/guanosine-5'-triphosphate,3'-diphosphate pyrophosphatase
MKKVAIIDMGTNTFHLMIAQVNAKSFTILSRDKVPVKIGAGGINNGIITQEGVTRALTTMKSFKDIMIREKINSAKAIGTSAFRNAQNGAEVAHLITNQTGIDCEIISGIEEAEYIYKGVRAAISLGKEPSLIMDIGGGSVEFIIGNEENIFWSHSFEIGGQRLLEKFQKHDPITEEEIHSIDLYFTQQLELLYDAINTFTPSIMIGSSGTFDTLSDIYCYRNNLPVIDTPETPFTIHAFDGIFQELLSKDRKGRMQIPGMIELRVDMIVVACCLINHLLSNYQFREIRVSSYSLKEGVLAELAVNN